MINESALEKYLYNKTGLKFTVTQEHSRSIFKSLSHYINISNDDLDINFNIKISDHFHKGVEDLNYPIRRKGDFKATILKNAVVVYIRNRLYNSFDKYFINTDNNTIQNNDLDNWIAFKLSV